MEYNPNNNPYNQPGGNPYMPPNSNGYPGQRQYIRNPGKPLATASMILGIVSIVTMFTVYIPFICGSLAIVLAILSKGYGKKMLTTARVGIGTGIGGIVLIASVVGSLVAMILSLSGDDLVNFGRQMDRQFEQQTGQELEDVFGQSYEDIMKQYAELMGK